MDKKLFKSILLLITYTVVLVMVLSRLGLIAGGVAWVLGLVKPLLIGFALAFVLNRPCHFFFRLYDRGLSRTRARGAARPLAVVTSYLVLILAIAAIFSFVVPKLVEKETISGTSIPAAFPDGTDTYKIYDADTCQRLKEMMRNNVVSQYGQSQFGDLAVCAKSGTAEVGGGQQPHSWFAGFVDDADNPLAFVVLVENGGSGAQVAGSIAAKILSLATTG